MAVGEHPLSLYDNKITIQYLGLETDKDGFPLVNENHIDAIAAYIEYKNASRTRWKSVEHRITETGIFDMRREWFRLCSSARADDGEPSESDLAEIRGMINDPTSGVGIAMFRYNDIWFNGY